MVNNCALMEVISMGYSSMTNHAIGKRFFYSVTRIGVNRQEPTWTVNNYYPKCGLNNLSSSLWSCKGHWLVGTGTRNMASIVSTRAQIGLCLESDYALALGGQGKVNISHDHSNHHNNPIASCIELDQNLLSRMVGRHAWLRWWWSTLSPLKSGELWMRQFHGHSTLFTRTLDYYKFN